MSKIPTKISEEVFETEIEPYLSKARRGFVSKISLEKIFNAILYKLNTGCRWKEVKIEGEEATQVTYQAIYWHYRKWIKDGSFKKVWERNLETMPSQLDLSQLNVDGNPASAKKRGKMANSQGRKS